jgi:hypothetical protein
MPSHPVVHLSQSPRRLQQSENFARALRESLASIAVFAMDVHSGSFAFR